MITKQKRTIIIAAAAFVVLLLAYIFIIQPLLIVPETEEEPPELLEGEVLGSNNRILMMEYIERADIQSIDVHNSLGTYTLYRGDDDEFYYRGFEGAPYSLELVSSLVTSAGYTLAMTRITTDCEDFSEYGLAPEDNPAWYVITKTDGDSHKVYIGEKIITGAGYYCRYDGRNAVYILDSTIGTTLLAHLNSLITPVLTYPVSTSSYLLIDDFYIIKDGKLSVALDYMTPEEIQDTASLGDFRMIYPTGYEANLTAFNEIFALFGAFNGAEMIEMGGTEAEMDPEYIKETYGIDSENPAYAMHYTYEEVESFVIFSQPDEDGMMYAYSSLFNYVASVSTDTAYFLKWDLIKFVDRPVFFKNINEISTVTINSDRVNASFTLEGEGTEIKITDSVNKRLYNADEVQNFRQFYKVMLSLYLEDYTGNSNTEELPCMATMTVVTDAGIETVYRFYPYSTRRCFYTVDGVGEFYIQRDRVDKLLNDTQRVINGETVNSDDKS